MNSDTTHATGATTNHTYTTTGTYTITLTGLSGERAETLLAFKPSDEELEGLGLWILFRLGLGECRAFG